MSFLCKKRVISQTLLEIITFLSIGSIPIPITYYLFSILFTTISNILWNKNHFTSFSFENFLSLEDLSKYNKRITNDLL